MCLCACDRPFFQPPTRHKLKTGVIRSSIIKGASLGKKFYQKMTSGGITDKKLRHQCFVNGENLELFVLSLEMRYIQKRLNQIKLKHFFKKKLTIGAEKPFHYKRVFTISFVHFKRNEVYYNIQKHVCLSL